MTSILCQFVAFSEVSHLCTNAQQWAISRQRNMNICIGWYFWVPPKSVTPLPLVFFSCVSPLVHDFCFDFDWKLFSQTWILISIYSCLFQIYSWILWSKSTDWPLTSPQTKPPSPTMADPLSLLRQYYVNKKEIVERNNMICFGEYCWAKNVKTNYMMYRYVVEILGFWWFLVTWETFLPAG